ncbi:MAG TPA: hypothetical protein VJ813_04885 [Vicinamibacterales bacterium]|nr:hypothetical protein [Vicinamibacterales bacterium]
MFAIPARTLLAGPIMRRSDRQTVRVWLAASSPLHIEGYVYDPKAETRLGSGVADTIAIGGGSTKLHVGLVEIKAEQGQYPSEQVLAYELLSGGAILDWPSARNASLGWTYGKHRRPTFVLRDKGPTSIFHASCRKPHGKGHDALRYGDQTLSDLADHKSRRPTALFLTGDQIYGDDVADALSPRVRELGAALTGIDEIVAWPGASRGRAVSTLGTGTRAAGLNGLFTSGEARNHLIGFSEYAAMYLLAWGEHAWSGFPTPEVARAKDLQAVWSYYTYVPHVRRLLANVPTYMIFDDHDVTDDWNLTPGWTFRATLHPLTRRVILNALAAYAVFQGWGNDPSAEWPDFLRRIGQWISTPERGNAAVEEELLQRHWGYVTPAHPAVLVLDTRSHRVVEGRAAGAAPQFIDKTSLATVAKQLEKLPSPVVVVSPVPFIGLAALDLIQRGLAGLIGKESVDAESWLVNSLGLYGFRAVLHERAKLNQSLDVLKPSLRESRFIVVLSGDVHYSTCASEVLAAPGATDDRPQAPCSRVIQFTSSAAKNAWVSSAEAKFLLRFVLGQLSRGQKYAVYMQPKPSTVEEALRRLGGGSTVEQIQEAVESGAPLALDRPVATQAMSYVQHLALLNDTSNNLALTFDSSIGWLEWNEDRMHMTMLEWDGKTTEIVDGQTRPKLSTRTVTITRD